MSAGVTVESTRIPGVVQVRPPFHQDARGSFAKPYSQAVLEGLGVPFPLAEVYWSQSAAGTVRGMHFQVPPTTIAKIVFATAGRVRDVVLDLRVGSPSYGLFEVFDLGPESGSIVVPVGCAHGFEVVDGPACLTYLQVGDFDSATDAGVRWDSFGMDWKTVDPILSARDSALPPLNEFDSPFRWEAS